MMNNKSSSLISIIVAVFNGANKLQHCIDSVSQQAYQNKELIIIDGGSRDEIVDLIKSNNAASTIGYLNRIRIFTTHGIRGCRRRRASGWSFSVRVIKNCCYASSRCLL